MADQNPADQIMEILGGQTRFIRGLTDQVGVLSSAVGTQGSLNKIQTFNGEPKNYKKWIEEIEKYSLIFEVPDHKKTLLSYQASSGTVSDFIGRFLRERPPVAATWDHLKRELAARFGDIIDPQYALALLQKEKQTKTESVQFFAERLMTMAEDAFPDGDPRNDPAIERQLIQAFVDGLAHDFLKVRLLRDNPNTLRRAVEIATNEQDLRRKIELRIGKHAQQEDGVRRQFDRFEPRGRAPLDRRSEPMEIDHARRGRNCYNCDSPTHTARNCDRRDRNDRERTGGRHQARPNTVNMVRVQCWTCRRWGHKARQCSLN